MGLNLLLDIDTDVLAFFNDSHSLFFDSVAMSLTSGYTWIPLYLSLFYLVIKNNETMGQIALAVGAVCICLVLSDGVADFLVKPMVGRWRPSNDPIIKYSIDIVDGLRADKYGFFSAHAANTMAVATYFCLLVRGRLFTLFMLLWSLANCWTRLYLGLHYPSDIAVGLLWGAVSGLIAYLIYIRLYFKISPKLNYISSQYTSSGYSLPDIDVVIGVMMATVAVVMILSVI